MARDASQLLEEALQLPAEARSALADSLLDSLDAEIDSDAEKLWAKEIERRVASLKSGSVETIRWSEVEAHLRARLRY